MLVAPRVSYPGVYIQEVPSDVRTIVGVDTATTAFIGRAKRGPVDQPVVIHNFGDFERAFGGLWLQSTLGYAVRSFFLNGGAKAVVIRIYQFGAALQAAATVAAAVESALAQGATTADELKAKAQEAANALDATQEPLKTLLADVEAATTVAGLISTVRTHTPRTKARLSVNTVQDAAQNVADVARRGAQLPAATQESVVEATTNASNVYSAAPAAVKNAAESVKTAVAAAADLEAIKALDFAELVQNAVGEPEADAGITLEAVNEGSWGNQLRAQIAEISDIARGALSQQFPEVEADAWFSLVVHDGASGATEEFTNVTVVDGPRRLDKVLQGNSQLVRVAGTLPAEPPLPHLATTADDLWQDDFATSKVTETGRATDADTPNSNAVIGSEAKKTGLYALEDADIFNLLCIPPYAGNDVGAMAPVEPSVWTTAAKYCTDQRAIVLVDAPWQDKATAVTGMPIIAPSANAAIYFPQVKMANPLRDNQVETFAPSGLIAGIMARTDATRGVWKAPAGLDATLNGIVEPTVALTDDENGELNPLGVNCLRTRPAVGAVVWGARTLVGDDRLASQWKYLPVRRTALFIEETLYRNIQWAVFEPNDEPLWSQLRLNIGVFMNGLFRQGAFQGQSAKDAYFVKCDSTTTTQADIDKGMVNVVVGFAPLKPAEFVVIYLQQIAGQLVT